jgi:serine/threonine protein kinase
MDYVSDGSLKNLISKHGNLGENTAKLFTKQVLDGLCFLHSRKIVHRVSYSHPTEYFQAIF